MRRLGAAYVGAVVLTGLGGIALDAALAVPQADANVDLLGVALVLWALAVLTFPAGVVATATALVLIFMGIATPAEAAVLATPIAAGLGYVQWFRVVPYIYRDRG